MYLSTQTLYYDTPYHRTMAPQIIVALKRLPKWYWKEKKKTENSTSPTTATISNTSQKSKQKEKSTTPTTTGSTSANTAQKSIFEVLYKSKDWSAVLVSSFMTIIGKENHRHCIRDWNISDINAPPNRKVFYVPNVTINMVRTTLWERYFPTSSTTTTSTKNQCSLIVVYYPMHRIIGVTSWSRSRSETEEWYSGSDLNSVAVVFSKRDKETRWSIQPSFPKCIK